MHDSCAESSAAVSTAVAARVARWINAVRENRESWRSIVRADEGVAIRRKRNVQK
jgi:hypothetical protein